MKSRLTSAPRGKVAELSRSTESSVDAIQHAAARAAAAEGAFAALSPRQERLEVRAEETREVRTSARRREPGRRGAS